RGSGPGRFRRRRDQAVGSQSVRAGETAANVGRGISRDRRRRGTGMRPYLAILRDSFREALLSRTLPFLLGFFTLVLLVLAPISLEEDVPWRLSFEEIA